MSVLFTPPRRQNIHSFPRPFASNHGLSLFKEKKKKRAKRGFRDGDKVQLKIPISAERHWFVKFSLFLNCVLLGSNCLTSPRPEEEYKTIVIKKIYNNKKKCWDCKKGRLYKIR